MVKKVFYKRCREESCRRRGKLLSINNFYKHKGSKNGRRPMCKECFKVLYKDSLQRSSKSRQQRLKDSVLLTAEETELIYNHFDHKCALTGKSEEVSLDHFIPISWEIAEEQYGIGGNVYENMLPLNLSLNKSKSSHNPFIWIKTAGDKYDIETITWERAVAYMAKKNNMSPLSYENKVFQCHMHVKVKSLVEYLNGVVEANKIYRVKAILRYALRDGVNIDVATHMYGSKELIQLLNQNDIKLLIATIKKRLEEQ